VSELVFADTGAWFASVVPWDANRPSAVQWLRAETRQLLTTDFIVDETLTLLKARGEMPRALHLGRRFFTGGLAARYDVTEQDLQDAWHTFETFEDKDWSFTDCTSKVVIERLGLKTAFSFDHHFHQFGCVVVVP
jgi:hypothetical protein